MKELGCAQVLSMGFEHMMQIHREKSTQGEQGYACVYAQEWAHAWGNEFSFRREV